jgi:hypothetical protein
MADLIFKRIVKHEWLAGWEQLSQEERDAYLAKLDETVKQAGGRRLVFIQCDAAYATQEWDTFGMEIFPDMEAAQKHAELIDQLNVDGYVARETLVGTVTDLREWLHMSDKKANLHG